MNTTNTTITSAQLQSFLRLLDEKKVTPEHFTRVLASGILADVVDLRADLSKRFFIRRQLGVAPVFRTDTTVVLGLHADPHACRNALRQAGVESDEVADLMLDHAYVLEERHLDIVILSLGFFDFDKASYSEVCDRALQCGLELCPVDLGPALACHLQSLSLAVQNRIPWSSLAMKPVTVSHSSWIFRYADRLLCAQRMDDSTMLSRTDTLVFVLPKTA